MDREWATLIVAWIFLVLFWVLKVVFSMVYPVLVVVGLIICFVSLCFTTLASYRNYKEIIKSEKELKLIELVGEENSNESIL